MDQVKQNQLLDKLGGVYADLLGLVAQREVVDRYVGEFSIAYMVDEEIAYLTGDSAATTYFGCTITQGRTSVLDRLKGMRETVQAILDGIPENEDL